MSSRLQQLLQTFPPASLAILGFISCVYILQILLDFHVRQFTLCPADVVTHGQVWRLATSIVLHGSLMHIGMNLMSGVGLCNTLEHTIGTVALLLTTVQSAVVTPILHVVLASLAHFVFGYHAWFQQHSLGFSGILFHYAVIEASFGNGRQTSRSVFGVFTVPAIWYPWALLLLLQLFIPHLSFLGHLSGILAGTLQVHWNLYFQSAWLEERMAGWHNFVPANTSINISAIGGDSRASLRRAPAMLCLYIGYVLETIKVIFWGRSMVEGNSISIVSAASDGEWIGLPLSLDDGDDTLESQIV